MSEEPEALAISGLRKAAILMVLLGDKAAIAIYRHLAPLYVERLTREISTVDHIPTVTAAQVLEEFNRLAITQEYLATGGPDYAERLLVEAFGEGQARDLLDEVKRSIEAQTWKLDSLQEADPAQLAKFVALERPQTIALILAHLGARPATNLLKLLPDKTRAQVVERMAKLQQFSADMVRKISVILHKKLENLGADSRLTYGGITAVAEVLNRMDMETSKSILEMIEEDDAKLALDIRNVMFTFEDLRTIPESSVREIIGQVDKKTLAVSLKGASDDLKKHVFKTMSSRAAEMLKEDMEVMGLVRSREVHEAQQEVVTLARKLESEGRLVLRSEGEDAYVV